jgi:hypothetical protein
MCQTLQSLEKQDRMLSSFKIDFFLRVTRANRLFVCVCVCVVLHRHVEVSEYPTDI